MISFHVVARTPREHALTRWGGALAACALLVSNAAFMGQKATQSAAARLTLKGTVSRDDGTPIQGATAYIYTAAVRRGTSPF